MAICEKSFEFCGFIATYTIGCPARGGDTLVRAQELHLKGRLSEAETLYREVMHRHQDTVQALQGLGALAYQQGRIDEAAGWFSRIVAIKPNNPRLNANLGEFLRLLGRLVEAVDHLRGD